ncbi:MAG: hypothetical protein AABM67_21290 [Acidobacteriota bacterium]
MSARGGRNWVQFIAGAVLGALIGFSLWMSLPKGLTYSALAGVVCIAGMALLIGWLVSRGWRSQP